MKNIAILLILSLSVPACSSLARDNNWTKFGGYIAPPSNSFDGAKPEAKWIWDDGEANPHNYYLHFRKSFTLDNPVKDAKAFISAFAFAEVHINGKYVDRVPSNPDPEYQTYEEVDLTPYLKKGQNTIAALVYNAGVGLHHRMVARGGFFFQAVIVDVGGQVAKINSDESWRVTQAVAWDTNTKIRQDANCIGMRERYDARLAYEAWQKTSFDDSDWKFAKEIGVPPLEPWNQIVAIKRERLQRETIKPVANWSVNGYKVYDFGKEITAYPQFTLAANKAGIELTIGTSESLDEKRFPVMKINVDYTDTYITKKGVQSWHPITWRGYRYFAIKENPHVSIDSVSAIFRSFPVKRKGGFSCSDQELNRIWEIGRWTMQICAHDTWMDTPWREQTQYIAGDTRYDMRYSVYAFAPNMQLLHKYNILSGAFSQRHSDKGAIRARSPTGAHLGPTTSTYIPDYQLEWILMLREYHMFYEDEELLKQIYPNLKKLLQYFELYRSEERGLVGQVPGWVVLDHPDTYKMDVGGENTAMNCLYHGALKSAAWIARNIMKDEKQADEWQHKAQAVKTSIQKHLWSEKDNAFKDGYQSSRITQQTQVYALKYGLVPEDKKAEVVEYVMSQGRSCEQSFSYWLLHTMFSEGSGQWALDYIRKNWGAQMRDDGFNGAWYELWEASPGMSKSHAWCSGPTALLPEFVLGVEPIAPGWKQFKIQPRLSDLKWAEGVVPSVAGDIHVKLKKLRKGEKESGLRIEVVVPENTRSKIYIPAQSGENFAIYVDDKQIWKDGKVVEIDKTISYSSKSDEFIVFEFQPGNYVIKAVDGDA